MILQSSKLCKKTHTVVGKAGIFDNVDIVDTVDIIERRLGSNWGNIKKKHTQLINHPMFIMGQKDGNTSKNLH